MVIHKFTWNDLTIDPEILSNIVSVGLPAGIQSIITSLSNIFVQSYINHFGSDVMAGWSTYNKLDQFIMLPMQSIAMAATTFVSQNLEAGKDARAEEGTRVTILLTVAITGMIAVLLFIFAPASI